MAEWFDGAGFARGLGRGVWNTAKDATSGLIQSGENAVRAGYWLATDPAYREQAYADSLSAIEKVSEAATHPQEFLLGLRDRAVAAWDGYLSERALAIAEGRLDEFNGELAGGGLVELASLPAGPGKLREARELLAAAQLGRPAAAAEAGFQAVERGKELVPAAPGAKLPCPGPAAPGARRVSTRPGTVDGEAVPAYERTPTAGEPISLVNGEQLLALDDFTWHGPLSLTWRRFYRSRRSGDGLPLGHGWFSPLDQRLSLEGDRACYHDPEGRAIELPLPKPGGHSRNLPERLRLARDPDGFRLTGESGPQILFHPDGRLAGWGNDYGHRIELVYGDDGQIQALHGNWGSSLLLERQGRHITALIPARRAEGGCIPVAQPLIRYRHDAAGDLLEAADRLGHAERYAYARHLLTRRTLKTGFAFEFEWDGTAPKARCLRSRGENGIYDTRFEWTDTGLSRAIDARGGISICQHDAHGHLLWRTSPEGRTTRYAYDRQHRLRRRTDGNGHATVYEYDDAGRLVQVTDPLGHAHRYTHDPDGRLTAYTDPLGETWTRAYDPQGRLLHTQDPQGGLTRYTYNDQGLTATVTNPAGQTRTLWWDQKARLVGDIGFDGLRTAYRYDAEDRIVGTITQDRLTTAYAYDPQGRLLAVKAPDGAVTRLAYNPQGQLARYTDPLGRVTEYRYVDGLAQPSERIDPNGHTLTYHYDRERNLIGLTNPKGERYTLRYDLDEALIETVGFDGREQRYHYDRAGRLDGRAERTEGGWHVTRYRRDPLGRLLEIQSPDGRSANYAYDPLGRLIQADNADAILRFAYTPLGQLAEETQNDDTLRHRYDALGRRIATDTPAGCLDYAYDPQGRLSHLSLDGQTLTHHRFDELGRETARSQGALESRYTYDAMGRLLRQQAGRHAPLIDRLYGYDPAGNLATVDDLRHGQTRYYYDPAERLIRVDGLSPETFVHDPAGNLVGLDRAAGEAPGDRLQRLGDSHYLYDGAGNRIEERRGRAVLRYRYDSDHRLIQADTPEGTSRYRYDALGRRIAKLTPQGETRFLYDGPRLLSETQSQHTRTYVFEPESFRPLARIDGAGAHQTIYHYHLDAAGAPREITDAHGRLAWSASYRAYGALALADLAAIDNPLRFQGHYFDAETGLHYSLNRYYDPETGSFIHQDPIGLGGGTNPYRYAPNPINWIDPLGLSAKDCVTNSLNNGNISGSLITELQGGGSWLMTEEQYQLYARGRPVIGRPDGQFIVSAQEMNTLILQTEGDTAKLSKMLGTEWAPDAHLIRMDVLDPLQHNPRLPSRSLSGANSKFVPGGKTINNIPEIVIDPVPTDRIFATPVKDNW